MFVSASAATIVEILSPPAALDLVVLCGFAGRSRLPVGAGLTYALTQGGLIEQLQSLFRRSPMRLSP